MRETLRLYLLLLAPWRRLLFSISLTTRIPFHCHSFSVGGGFFFPLSHFPLTDFGTGSLIQPEAHLAIMID